MAAAAPLQRRKRQHVQVDDVRSDVLALFFSDSRSGGGNHHHHHHHEHMPGPQPFSIGTKDLIGVSNSDYWACEKSDGERSLLYISSIRKCAYLVDRKWVTRKLDHGVYASLWTKGDSLFDGEMLSSTSFNIFDVVSVNGQSCRKEGTTERIAIMMKAQSDWMRHVASHDHIPVLIYVKQFFKKAQIDLLFKCIKQVSPDVYEYNDGNRRNKNDGIVFIPNDQDYFGSLLKWKWVGMNTIDFALSAPWFDNKDKLMMYSSATDADKRTVLVHSRSTTLSAERRSWLLSTIAERKATNVIVEMQYVRGSSSWVPIKFRWDKATPNHMTTVVATMETIIDNVTVDDIMKSCGIVASSSSSFSSSSSSSSSSPPLSQFDKIRMRVDPYSVCPSSGFFGP